MATEPMRAGGHVNHGDGRGWVLAGDGPDCLVPVDERPPSGAQAAPTVDAAAGQDDAAAEHNEGQDDAATAAEPEPSSDPSPAELTGPAPKPSTAEVRKWAREQGLDVPARGPVPTDLIDGYIAATTEDGENEEASADG